MQIAGLVSLERLVPGPGGPSLQIAQIADAMPPQATVEAGARDLRVQELPDHSQQVVERHQERLAQDNHYRLLRRGQGGLQPVRRVAAVMHRVSVPPFVDRLLGRAVPLRQHRGGRVTGLDRRPDLWSRRCPRHCPRTSGGQWLDCEDGSACAHPIPNVPQNRSCHEKRGSPRVYVIIRDGTPMHHP